MYITFQIKSTSSCTLIPLQLHQLLLTVTVVFSLYPIICMILTAYNHQHPTSYFLPLENSKLACTKLHNSLCPMPSVSCRHSGLNMWRSLFSDFYLWPSRGELQKMGKWRKDRERKWREWTQVVEGSLGESKDIYHLTPFYQHHHHCLGLYKRKLKVSLRKMLCKTRVCLQQQCGHGDGKDWRWTILLKVIN